MTMTLIETKTLGAAAATIEFTSIPTDGTDLVALLSLRGNNSGVADDPIYRFNSDSGSNYSYRFLVGAGSGTPSSGSASTTFNYLGNSNGNTSTADTFSNHILYIPNYTSSVAKSSSVDAVSENNATEAYQRIIANLWTGTTAINTLTITSVTSTQFLAGSIVSLYKITKGSDGIVTTSP
jgi:hypothetical protein